MTATKTESFMQCPCMMQGSGVEQDTGRETFRHRTFHITSKDHSDMVHKAVFQWKEEDRHSTGECFGQV